MIDVQERAASLGGDLADLRHAPHREPEVGLQLPGTQRKVLGALGGLPLEITTGVRLTSVTAVLRGGRPGPAVLLRADMDGLQIEEKADVPLRSRTGEAMHACGHDFHTAMLVGAAHLLAGSRDELPGSVVFMFQPGEEGCDGAGHMIAEGVLDAAGSRPVAAYALHVMPRGWAHGTFATRSGPSTPVPGGTSSPRRPASTRLSGHSPRRSGTGSPATASGCATASRPLTAWTWMRCTARSTR
jgi:hippurate hydrolase